MEEKKIPRKYYKDDIHNNMTPSIHYAILTLGKKYKEINQVSGFEAHMTRKEGVEIPNANAALKYLNQNLRGSNEVVATLKHYLSDTVPWKKNQVCARELLVTASKRWFDNQPEERIQLWINENVKFLQQEFGDNFLFGICHRDEGAEAPHIHCLIGCKFYDQVKQHWKIQHYKYFDGKEKLQGLQTRYAEHMQKTFPELQRGVMYSKAKFYEVQKFYGTLTKDNLNLTEEEAKTRLQLQDIKFKRLEGTVNNLKTINNRLIIENSELADENKELREENTVMTKAIKDLMIRRHIPQQDYDLSLTKVQTQSNSHKVGS